MAILETKIEKATVDLVMEFFGWSGVEVYGLKLNILGNRGWPDRIFIWGEGQIMFVEFKRPGEKPRKLQLYTHQLLRKLGFEVQVHDDVSTAVGAIKAHILSTLPAATRDEIIGQQRRWENVSKTGPRKDGL